MSPIGTDLEIWSYQSPLARLNMPGDRCPRTCRVRSYKNCERSSLSFSKKKKKIKASVQNLTPEPKCLHIVSLILFYFPHPKGKQKSLDLMGKCNE